MKLKIKYLILSIFIILFLFTCKTSNEDVKKSKEIKNRLMERIANRETPPIYKDWKNYPDIKGLDKYRLTAKFTVSWDAIEPKGESANWGGDGTLLGLEWDRTRGEYPTLTKNIINIEEAKKIYDMMHQLNPNIMLGVEVRWDAIKDYELPPNHRWWKRDKKGNRVKYGQSTPPRYEVNEKDPAYLKWLGERCKAILDTGVVDFIFLDHILYMQTHAGDPLPALKAIRKAVGPDAVIIGNTHYVMMKEISKYIDAWGEDEPVPNTVDVIRFWEQPGRAQPRFNCWEFYGIKDDLKKMRYFTTLVMTNSNASVRYIDHIGSTRPSPWYDFWDVKIGKFTGSLYILNDCYAREYSNGTTVCNNSGETQKIIFNEIRERASNNEKAKKFTLEKKDGDMFLYVK
ncbi:MAG: hypothetical protein JXB50_07425 [Spirochaetes bacterium]|nr:hypothetical protein [Spirochaetota bacterium]